MVTPKSSSPSYAMAPAQTAQTNAVSLRRSLPEIMVGSHALMLFVIGSSTRIVILSNVRLSLVPSLLTNLSLPHIVVNATAPCVRAMDSSASQTTLFVVSASSTRSKMPCFFSVPQETTHKIPPSPYQTVHGHPPNRWILLLQTPIAALPYHSLMTLLFPGNPVGVNIVPVLQGTVLSPTFPTRDASVPNIPFCTFSESPAQSSSPLTALPAAAPYQT